MQIYPESLRFVFFAKVSHQGDAFGVLGVWPAAWVAAQRAPRRGTGKGDANGHQGTV